MIKVYALDICIMDYMYQTAITNTEKNQNELNSTPKYQVYKINRYNNKINYLENSITKNNN